MNILKVGGDINLPAEYTNETALYFAAEGGHDIVVKELIRRGALVNLTNSRGISPLYIASQSGYVHVVKALLEADVEVNQAVDGVTPLMIAAIRGKSDIIKLLAQSSRINLDQQNNLGETALMLCSVSRDVRCIESLMEKGAKIEMSDDKGYTPLIHAAIRNCPEIVEYLVEKGCDMEATDRGGLTALQHAAVTQSKLI